ncbi:MAG: hypothetical protein IKD68_07640, partial [Solobacterium sp.]|nr:hypothetical protein [Solobacterium sp.]
HKHACGAGISAETNDSSENTAFQGPDKEQTERRKNTLSEAQSGGFRTHSQTFSDCREDLRQRIITMTGPKKRGSGSERAGSAKKRGTERLTLEAAGNSTAGKLNPANSVQSIRRRQR